MSRQFFWGTAAKKTRSGAKTFENGPLMITTIMIWTRSNTTDVIARSLRNKRAPKGSNLGQIFKPEKSFLEIFRVTGKTFESNQRVGKINASEIGAGETRGMKKMASNEPAHTGQ